jgi:hypothetical protein
MRRPLQFKRTGDLKMPTCTKQITSRRTEDRRSSLYVTAQSADEHAVRVDPDGPDPTDNYEMIDFWGSRDSLSRLANWG